MADVINLGQMGQRRESPASGVSEALATGLQIGQRSKAIQAKENEYKNELAALERQKLEKERGFFKDTIENLSMQRDKLKSQKEVDAFEQSEAYQGVVKMANRTIGGEKVGAGWYDKETKKLLLPTLKGMASERVEKMETALIEKVNEVGWDGLNKREQFMLDAFKKAGTDPVATVMSSLMRSQEFQMLILADTPETNKRAGNMFESTLQIYLQQGGRGSVRIRGGGKDEGGGGGSPLSDPLGMGLK